MEIIDRNLQFSRLVQRSKTDSIIIHHAAGLGTVESVHNYHKNVMKWAGIAYHFYITRDGKCYRGRPELMRGGHTQGYNNRSIGICLEGNLSTMQPMLCQYKTLNDLVEILVSKYKTIENIWLHRDVNSTECPGNNFDWRKVDYMTENRKINQVEYVKELKWCVDKGLFKGDGNGNYRWKDSITREEIALVLYRFYELVK